MTNLSFSEPEYDNFTKRYKSTANATNAKEIVATNNMRINMATNFNVEISGSGNTIKLLGTTKESVYNAINIINQ